MIVAIAYFRAFLKVYTCYIVQMLIQNSTGMIHHF